jgi:glucose-6-phosphate-specific signal transduction histidine kinase
MTSFIKGVMVTRSEIRDALEKYSTKLGVDSEVLKVRTQITKRSLANHLHGNVQNKLLLLALKLERGDDLKTREELIKIRELLDLEIGNPEDSVFNQLEGLVSRWEGFVEIELSVTGILPENTEIAKVASEAVNNSVRHGLAHRIWITLECKPGCIVMTVDDDGIGPRTGKSGLGTKYFNSVAGNSWTLAQREAGGSRLKLLVPAIV